jgi:hypothetical protein
LPSKGIVRFDTNHINRIKDLLVAKSFRHLPLSVRITGAKNVN